MEALSYNNIALWKLQWNISFCISNLSKLHQYLYCGRVPAANAPGCTAAEGLLYKPWSLVVPNCTVTCLHQRP